MKNDNELLSAKDTADLLGISINSFYALVKKDPSFPAIRINNKWKTIRNKIPDWYDQQLTNKNPNLSIDTLGINGEKM